ncbi:magnesium transporter [Thalassotalea aquiviva]|uniref:magnesium transporter n=1 Tax=Thalassotalea aquiviva TaxID=3242415 RepID=UPI00352B980C
METVNSAVDLDELIELLESEPLELGEQYEQLNAFQWSGIFESLTNEQRLALWPYIDSRLQSGTLSEMREDARLQFLSVLPQGSIEQTIRQGTNNEAVDILESLPEKAVSKIIKKLTPANKSQIETSLSYDEEQVGRYTNQQVYTIDEQENVAAVLDELKSGESNLETSNFIVVDEHMQLLGEISLNELLNANEQAKIGDLCQVYEHIINAEQSLLEASNLIQASQKNYLPVVKGDGQFFGVFSIHDALDVFQEYYEAQFAHLGKVSDEDLFSPVLVSSRRRAVWLGINLITAFLASMVIGLFDKVLVEVVALAVLMPIVASMGGITGSQSLTLTVRGLATGQISPGNLKTLRNKEFLVAFSNSLLWAVLISIICYFWFENPLLSFLIALAIVINMLVASLSGVYIPVLLEKFGVDPAIAGSVILTTVTDVVGFWVFLGSASLVFLL